ncbi:MAG: transglutaminase-like domain-containing protein [Polyangiales bacterium]
MIKKALAGWRHPTRALAMAMAALSLSWGVALTEALVSAMVGAVLGVVLGELLGRSRLRLGAVMGLLGASLIALWQVAAVATRTEVIPEAIGPGNALVFASVVRFGALATLGVAAMRAVAVRRPAALALELAAVAAAFTTVFSAHREGVIARPLWLSDWAWQQGVDPVHVFLAIGGVSVTLLAVLLVAETRSGRAVSSVLTIIGLAVLATMFVSVVGAPTPAPMSELGLTDAGMGQPPRRTDAGGHGPNGDQQNDGGGGGRGEQGDCGDGGGMGGDGGLDGGGRGGDGGLDGGNGAGGDAGDGGGGGAGDDGGDGGGSSGGDGGEGGTSADGGGDGSANLPRLIDLDGATSGDGGMQLPQNQRWEDMNAPGTSPAPMAVVILDDDYSPPSGAYYFRQEVWSMLQGFRLVQTNRGDVDNDIAADFPTADMRIADIPPTTGRSRVSGRVALLVPHTRPFALESPARYRPMANPNPQRFVRAWRWESLSQTVDYRRLIGHPAGDHRWSPEVRAYFTQPHPDPRFGELARRIVAERLPARLRNDGFAQALAVKLWLDHELTYSTRHRHAGVADPTVDFLFGNRTGYCVHFAHAAVFLWRSLGIPSRISAGYHSDEANRRGGSTILLRGADAHAWPELYVDGYGWIVLDIAAERNLDPPGSGTDDDLQRILGEMARQQPPDPERPQEQPAQNRQARRRYARDFGVGLLAALLGALAVMYLVKLWRRVIPAVAGARSLPRVAYRRALDQLAEAGLSREWGESRERFAERVKDVSPTFARMTALHVAAKLGDPAKDPASREEFDAGEWSRLAREVSREIPKGTKRWRRWLGLAHPGSWLDAR